MKKNPLTNQDGGYSPGREDRWTHGIKLVLDLVAKKPEKDFTILDVGCGDGSFLGFLKKKALAKGVAIDNVKYFGLDVNASYKRKIEQQGGSFIHGDALNIIKSTGNKKFDIIIAADIIEHNDETDIFINQLKKSIRHEGIIYLTTPNLAAWHCRLMLLFGFQPLPTEVSNENSVFGKGFIGKKIYNGQSIHHVRLFTYRALREFLKYHKIEVVKAVGSGYRSLDSLIFRGIFIGLAPLIVVVLKNRPVNK